MARKPKYAQSLMDREKQIQDEALWIIQMTGSDAGERQSPGSKALGQSQRIARFVRQLDIAAEVLNSNGLDMLGVVGVHTTIDPQQSGIRLTEEQADKLREVIFQDIDHYDGPKQQEIMAAVEDYLESL